MANEPQPETAITPSTAPMPTPSREETAIALPRGSEAATDAARSVPMTEAGEEAPAWLAKADWLLLGLLVVLSLVIGASPVVNPDVWLQLATGRLIAHGEYLPGAAEPFSVATEAREGHAAVPWINHSWIFGLMLFGLYSAAGPTGVVIFKALLVAAVTVVLIQVRNRDTNLLILAICLTLSALAMGVTRLYLQPVLVSYLFLALTLLFLHRAGVFDSAMAGDTDAPRNARWLWALPVLCVLWVNLDNWFVLGPLTIGLCWAGLAVERWRGLIVRVPVGRLGLVFGVSLVACLISPFHVRVFQLPPELAYLVMRGADYVGLDLPNAIVGGGRTVAVLHEIARDAQQIDRMTLSPLSESFRTSPHFGYNVCGVCFFPLLVLGLASFVLQGIVAGKPGAPAPHAARFLVWLAFAALAALLHRMIPFFAVIAGPITALNFSELLAWYATPTAAGEPPMPWVAPARLVRILGVPMLLALGLLAWPGWLNGPFDVNMPQHVVWDIPVDTSLQKAAERLAELPDSGQQPHGPRVFSTGLDLNAYCAWFAPGVKGFIDARLNLFPEAINDYRKAREALWDKNRPASEWSAVLRGYGVRHVAAERFMTNRKLHELAGWWDDPARWREDYCDSHVAVFTPAAAHTAWPTDAVIDAWNRLAFGPVPPAERPSPEGLAVLPENRSLLDRYLQPPLRLPHAAREIEARAVYVHFVVPRALDVAKRAVPISTDAVASLPLAPGACSAPFSLALSSGMVLAAAAMPPATVPPELRDGYARAFWRPLDYQPPATPVLAMRGAWQTVAEAPANERCYVFLSEAIISTQNQEAYWINPRLNNPPQTLRAVLRQVERMAALQSAVEIGFSDPRLQLQVHMRLFSLYLEQSALDLALEQIKAAEAAIDGTPPVGAREEEEQRALKQGVEARRKGLENEVEQRKKAFAAKMAGHNDHDKARELLVGQWVHFTKDNKPISQPWGLTGLGLQLLQESTKDTKLDDKERLVQIQILIDRLFMVGYARQASALLDDVQEALGPIALKLQVYRAATHGRYDDLQATLAKLEQPAAAQTKVSKTVALGLCAALMAPPPLFTHATAAASARATQETYWAGLLTGWRVAAAEYYNLTTLRGIIALEAGDTAAARRHFDLVLRETGGLHFTEKPIAERYAALLAQYEKP